MIWLMSARWIDVPERRRARAIEIGIERNGSTFQNSCIPNVR